MNQTVRTAMLVLPLACSVAIGSVYAQTSQTTTAKPAGQSAGSQASGPQSSTKPSSSTPSSGAQTSDTQRSSTQSSGAQNAGAASQMPGEPAPPAHPLTTDQTREMLDLMGFKKNMDGMLTQTIAMQKQQAPFVPADVWTDFQSSFGSVDYLALLQPVFAKYLSQEDAAKALEFYRTPAGKHVLEQTPLLMRDIAMTSQQNGQKVSRDVITRHRPEIEAAQKKYQQDQQEKNGTPSAPGGAAAGSGSSTTPSNGTMGAKPGTQATPPSSTTAPNSTTSPNSTTPNSTTSKPQ